MAKKKKIIKEQTSEPVTNCDQSLEPVANSDQLVKVDANSNHLDSGDIVLSQYDIEKLIITIRGKQVLIDRDLAMIYGVETKALNQAAKRNSARFPERYRFQLTKEEMKELVTNCDRFNSGVNTDIWAVSGLPEPALLRQHGSFTLFELPRILRLFTRTYIIYN